MRADVFKKWAKPFKFVLVGCGRTGHCYATVIHNHPRMTLEAVIDPNAEAAEAFRHSFRCKSFGSVEEYLAAGHHGQDHGPACPQQPEILHQHKLGD